jgi:uncharacterized membrane-anchored protein YitT (DUF2179 family)
MLVLNNWPAILLNIRTLAEGFMRYLALLGLLISFNADASITPFDTSGYTLTQKLYMATIKVTQAEIEKIMEEIRKLDPNQEIKIELEKADPNDQGPK